MAEWCVAHVILRDQRNSRFRSIENHGRKWLDGSNVSDSRHSSVILSGDSMVN